MKKVVSLLVSITQPPVQSSQVEVSLYTPAELFEGLAAEGVDTFVAEAPTVKSCWLELSRPGAQPSAFAKLILTENIRRARSTTVHCDKPWGASIDYRYSLDLVECTGSDIDESSKLLGQCRFNLDSSSSEIKWVSKGDTVSGKEAMNVMDTLLASLGIRYTLLQDQAKTTDGSLLSVVKLIEGESPYYSRFGYKIRQFKRGTYMNSRAASQSQSPAVYQWATQLLQKATVATYFESFIKIPNRIESLAFLNSCLGGTDENLLRPLPDAMCTAKTALPAQYRTIVSAVTSLISDLLSMSTAAKREAGVSREFYLALSVIIHHAYFVKDRAPEGLQKIRLVMFRDAMASPDIWEWPQLSARMFPNS